MNNPRTLLLLAAIFGGLAVALGAFGAHGLKSVLSAQQLETFQTAVRYQMYHALALLFLALAVKVFPEMSALTWAGWGWSLGIVLFSGSLYVVSAGGARWLGAITPLGGVCFILGWVSVAWASLKG
ncbi:MAG TPA: DUF423 domain-containing protein [Anaerolineales bacterium]|nr:DUF423 domain-containing protein [Anaerolineales bacterium]